MSTVLRRLLRACLGVSVAALGVTGLQVVEAQAQPLAWLLIVAGAGGALYGLFGPVPAFEDSAEGDLLGEATLEAIFGVAALAVVGALAAAGIWLL